MGLERIVAAFTELVEETLPELLERVPDILAEAESASPAVAVRNLSFTVLPIVLIEPARAAEALAPLRGVVERAVAQVDARVPTGSPISFSVLASIDLVNAFDCVGVPIAPAARDAVRGWLSGVNVSRDDDRTSRYWTVGLAALALDDPPTLSRIAGPTVPLIASATYAYNVQGFVAHLAAAVATRAGVDTVERAWTDFLEHYDALRAAHMADEGTLLWAARVVHHRVAGAALGEVATRLHRELSRG